MSSQESQDLHNLHNLSMLRLSSAATSPESTSKPRPKFKKCTQCGTLKRRTISSSFQQPQKPNNLQESSASVDESQNLQEPIIPQPLGPPQQPPLHRFLSQPIFSETEAEKEVGFEFSGDLGVNISPENSKNSVGSLLRSISDPTVAINSLTNPQLPNGSRAVGPLSPVFLESPDSRRLKRMKKRMKEMSKWVEEVVKEDDAVEDHVSQDVTTNNNSKDESDYEHQEAVWVEKKGEGLIIHFKCPCGEGYEIFLFGNNCYYKLM